MIRFLLSLLLVVCWCRDCTRQIGQTSSSSSSTTTTLSSSVFCALHIQHVVECLPLGTTHFYRFDTTNHRIRERGSQIERCSVHCNSSSLYGEKEEKTTVTPSGLCQHWWQWSCSILSHFNFHLLFCIVCSVDGAKVQLKVKRNDIRPLSLRRLLQSARWMHRHWHTGTHR